ncbi:MAG: RNA methyltransferase [Pseudomonadota bacterium]
MNLPTPDRRERRRLLTVYGRNAVHEALQDPTLSHRTLHLARSNKRARVLDEIRASADGIGITVREHTREELARISRNGRQDQGVALDVRCEAMADLEDVIESLAKSPRAQLMALDGVTNPQNVGMIIRSITAAGLDGLLLADKGNPALGPLVIKASAGTVFRAPLLRCQTVMAAITSLMDHGFELIRLHAREGAKDLTDTQFPNHCVVVLGGESEGVSKDIRELSGYEVVIPMANGVESLNVAVSAALLAYRLKDLS